MSSDELAKKVNVVGSVDYRSLLSPNQFVIDALTDSYFMKTCINRVVKNMGHNPDFDLSATKQLVSEMNITINETNNYYSEQQKIITALPLAVRLHNDTIREIAKQLIRIDSLLRQHKEIAWTQEIA